MVMSGPPGSGKTLIARSMPGILPSLTIEEALDVTRIYSVADMLSADEPLIRRRPFRSPHHTVSYAGLIPAPCGRRAQVGVGKVVSISRSAGATSRARPTSYWWGR